MVEGWRWVGAWYVTWVEGDCDEEGWSYSFSFNADKDADTAAVGQLWHAAPGGAFGSSDGSTWVRRRRWERIMAPVARLVAKTVVQPPIVATVQHSPNPPTAAPPPPPLPPPPPPLGQELRPELQPEPEPEQGSERHWAAAAVAGAGAEFSHGVMRGAVGLASAAHSVSGLVARKTEAKDSGPLSTETTAILDLGEQSFECTQITLHEIVPNHFCFVAMVTYPGQEVSGEVLGATRIVASGVSAALKMTGVAAVRAGGQLYDQMHTATDEDEGEDKDKEDGSTGAGRLEVAKDVASAGIDAGVGIYNSLRRGAMVATEGVADATAEAVQHRHGAAAGEAARTVGASVVNIGNAGERAAQRQNRSNAPFSLPTAAVPLLCFR